jgi:superoxide dismutase, Fe-Mn family
MSNNYNRRNFIKYSGKAAIAASMVGSIVPALAINASAQPFKQLPLPYAYNALEPVIDALTMEIHYSKHAAGYTKNLNEACELEGKSENPQLDEILKTISSYSTKMRNNAGGHFNHEFFWNCMNAQNKTIPSEQLSAAIQQDIGSLDKLKAGFTDAASKRFGSGWAWLVKDKNNQLKIGSTANQDNPLMDVSELKGTPLLALDVWEHAYYLKYQNKRAAYIENWWSIVNWDFVSERFLTNSF